MTRYSHWRAVTQRAAALGLLMLTLTLMTGCWEGSRAMPPPANAEVARQALEKALSQWQSGQAAAALAAAEPKTYVNDHEWRDGRKLKQFQLAGPAEEVGPQVRLPVALDVEYAPGQVFRSQVTYSISTSPVVSIVRDDP